LKDTLGKNNFGRTKEFSTVDEVTWINLQINDLNTDTKPWSQREISLQELDQQELQTRKDYQDNPQTEPSGFGSVRLPLTSHTEDELRKLCSKQVNWVQLTLGENFEQIDTVCSKTISENDIADNIDFTQPQFYLYDLNGSIILIYCCPDEGTNVKNRMVYSTCKAGLSEQIKSTGVTVVKKFDVRTREEANIRNLTEETNRRTSMRFKPTKEMLKGLGNQNYSYGEESEYGETTSNSNIKSKLNRDSPQEGGVQTAFRIMKGSGGGSPKLPKGVVIPPPGAYS